MDTSAAGAIPAAGMPRKKAPMPAATIIPYMVVLIFVFMVVKGHYRISRLIVQTGKFFLR